MTSNLLHRSRARLLSLAIAGVVAGIGGCSIPEPPPFNPRDLQTDERSAAAEPLAGKQMPPLPTTLQSPFLPEPGQPAVPRPGTAPRDPATTGPAIGVEPVLRMSLQDLVQRAAANSLDVRVAGYQPAIDQSRVIEEEARFDPRFFTQAQYEFRNFGPNTSPFGGSPISEDFDSDTDTLAAGVRQNLSSGGETEIRYQTAYNHTNPTSLDPNPYFENQLVLELTQPLLRGFGNNISRARITVARNNQRISLLEFRKQLEDTLTEVERTYWQLVAAQRNVAIQEALLARHEQTAWVLSQRMRQDVQRSQVSQANAAYETQRAVVIRAKSQVRELSDQLKRLLNDPNLPVSSDVLILPATTPVETPIHFELADLVKTAMENRFDLAQEQLRVDSASTVVDVARNNLLPRLDLVGSFGGEGFDERWGGAFEDQADFSNLTWRVGLQFEIPLGNREARAIYQRTMLQRQQAIDRYRAAVEQAVLDVKNALREVETAWKEIAATRQARFAQADALRALELREAANEPLTPTFVDLKLNTQTRLAEVERAEANSISNYNLAIALLERAKGTLLRYDNVVMQEADRPFTVQLLNEQRPAR